MLRRTVLGALAAGGAGVLAGGARPLLGSDGDGGRARATAGGAERDTGPVELPVSSDELHRALPQDGIPAITEPAFAPDWSGVEFPEDAEFRTLPDDAPVIGVERDGEARAYPLLVLDRHEVVNDRLGGPLLVTYCPLCGSAIVAERRVGGWETQFGVSGYLYRQDLVLYDERTGSLWSQILATAIRGPRTGDTLTVLPSSLTSWAEWRAEHPDTVVLLPPPRSVPVNDFVPRDAYFRWKYSYEDEESLVGHDSYDGGVYPTTLVVGVRAGGVARAYPRHVVATSGVVNDTVGDLPVVVTTTPDGGLAAYERRVGGRAPTFAPDGPRHLRAADTRWERASGRAVDGRYAGERLPSAADHDPMLFRGWKNFNPDSDVYGIPDDQVVTPAGAN